MVKFGKVSTMHTGGRQRAVWIRVHRSHCPIRRCFFAPPLRALPCCLARALLCVPV